MVSCGISKYSDAGIEGGSMPSGNIVGGWEARPHEFPWQVLIRDTSILFVCHGF